MTIHHDKSAYGKLKPTEEVMSEEKILEMIKILNGEKDTLSDCADKTDENNSHNKK